MLFRFINEMFNFCMNVVGKPIINKCLFYIFKFIKGESSRRELFGCRNKCFCDASFITEGAFTMEIESAGINVGKF